MRRASERHGPPPELAATKHLGKRLDRKRARAARKGLALRREQANLAVPTAPPETALPGPQTLVIEALRSNEGRHLFAYPFAGRMVRIGMASLLAWRAAREAPGTFSISMNDYRFEHLSPQAFDWRALIDGGLLGEERLLVDILGSLNASELAQRRFREIARIAGLVFQGFPGAATSTRQVQASSSLFFEVFRKHDRGIPLLTQADTEALEQEMEIGRLRRLVAALEAEAG